MERYVIPNNHYTFGAAIRIKGTLESRIEMRPLRFFLIDKSPVRKTGYYATSGSIEGFFCAGVTDKRSGRRYTPEEFEKAIKREEIFCLRLSDVNGRKKSALNISFTIPLTPITKKNSQRILMKKTGQRFIAPSPQYKQYEKDALWFIPRQDKPIDIAVNAKCLFYMPDHRRVDLPNLEEAIDDIMVKAGFIADDNSKIIAAHDGSRVLYDKENPRTEVYITRLEV